ncbi:hypothetical protein ACVIDN_002254 [Rhizobium brockwellii]|jgi:hypothetical protein
MTLPFPNSARGYDVTKHALAPVGHDRKFQANV